ncbi:uncharacterized protein stg1 [Procambarus clarkii]|uniref:uncharacterized protein stg1 n=1 Tax=Procambarus clarkii TaxID=6728 RepID=UPI001E672ABA|nr:uncharacterized protein LOC123755779 [Procambarus clarkii]
MMLGVNMTEQLLWVGTPLAAMLSGVCVLAAISGSCWLTSEERMPNPSYRNGSSRVEYLTKGTVSGLFTLCSTEVGKTEFRCTKIDYFPDEIYSPDPQDSTTAIPYTVLKSAGYFLTAAALLTVAEVLCLNGHCCRRRRFLTFVSGITFVVAGLVMMVGVVVYIATLKGEVGDKLRPRSSFQPPRFTYTYGWCFLLLMPAFLASETAGIAAIFLYIYWHKREWREKCEVRVRTSPRSLHHHHHPHHISRTLPAPLSNPRCGGGYMLEYVAVDQYPDALHHNHAPNHYPDHNHVSSPRNTLYPQQQHYQLQQHFHQQQQQYQQQHLHHEPRQHRHSSGSQEERSDSPVWAASAPPMTPTPPTCGRGGGGGRSLSDLPREVWWGDGVTGGGTLPRSNQKMSANLPWAAHQHGRGMSLSMGTSMEGLTLSRGTSMEEMTLHRGASMEGVTLSRGASMEGVTLSRGASMEGVTLSRGASMEGITQSRGASMEDVTLSRGASMEGITLPRGISMEGVTLPAKEVWRYNSVPRGRGTRHYGTSPGLGLLATAGGGSCPACCTYCDSCCCCCCCWPDDNEAADNPKASMLCSQIHKVAMSVPAIPAANSTSFCLPVASPQSHASPTRLTCTSPTLPQPCYHPKCYQHPQRHRQQLQQAGEKREDSNHTVKGSYPQEPHNNGSAGPLSPHHHYHHPLRRTTPV